MNLCSTVSYKIAKLLNNRIYSDLYDYKYSAGDVEVTFDNCLGVTKYTEGELIEYADNIHGKYYYAPTYAEVIDWLFNRRIVIEFKPSYTFALVDRVAYYFTVYLKDDGGFKKIFDQNTEMSSFNLAIETIIEFLINEKYID